MKVKAPYSGLTLTAVRPRGWIAEQLDRDIRGFAGHLHLLSKEAASRVFTDGRISGNNIRAWWDGETEGNWIDGLTRMAYLTEPGDAVEFVRAYMRRIIEEAGKAGGYVGMYREDWRFRNDGANGELWTYSRMLLALHAYYEASGDGQALETMRSSADLLLRHYSVADGGVAYFDPDGEEHDLGKSHGLMVVEPLLLLYELTGDDRLVEFAVSLYEDFSRANIDVWGRDCQLPRLLDADEPYCGHGAHTCEHVRIPLLLYHYTGEPKYKTAYEHAFAKLERYATVSGACKSDEMIGAETFSCVPLPASGYEYCAVTEQLLSLHTAAQLTGEARYADQAEWLLFNAAQALKSHDGRGIAYLGADNLPEASKRIGASWDISPTHDDQAVCCVPNAARIMPYHVSRMWLKTDDGGLALMFYGPNAVKADIGGATVSIEQQTDYPFGDTVRLTLRVSRPVAFPLKLRVPGWSRGMSVRCPEGVPAREGDYEVLRRTWRDGDEVIVRFGMAVEKIEAVDHTAALRRGPLLYALAIPSVAKPTRQYALPGFADLDCTPQPATTRREYTLRLRSSEPDLGFSVVRRDSAYCWDESPVALAGQALNWHAWPEDVTLVPIGCTRLRTTCSPYVDV